MITKCSRDGCVCIAVKPKPSVPLQYCDLQLRSLSDILAGCTEEAVVYSRCREELRPLSHGHRAGEKFELNHVFRYLPPILDVEDTHLLLRSMSTYRLARIYALRAARCCSLIASPAAGGETVPVQVWVTAGVVNLISWVV